MTPTVNIKAFKCNKCGHIWLSKQFLKDGKTIPIACAKCKSAYWNRAASENTKVTMHEGKAVRKE